MYELYGDLPQVLYTSYIDLKHSRHVSIKGGTNEDDIVRGVAAMSPFTADDTREGLQSKLRQLHGETQGEAERLTWKQKTR